MPKIEEMTQADVDALAESVSKLEGAVDRYKKENQKFREERDNYKAQAEAGEVNEGFKTRALQAEAKLRLNANGVKDPDRIIKYLKFDTVEFDEKEGFKGLDESIETVRTDFPELFDAKRRVGGKIDAAATGDVKTEKSVTDMQVDKLFSRR